MSGHSKWHRIKRKKAVTDAKRGQEFTRLAIQIKTAARANPDPAKNAALAEAISRAKAANMPQVNIDRLLNHSADHLEEVLYEAFGPSGISLLITALTDNTNRTVSEIRTILKKHGGSLGQPGSVAWKFTPQTTISFSSDKTALTEDYELALIEAGAEDISMHDGLVEIIASPETAPAIKAAINTKVTDINTAYTPLQQTPLNSETKETLNNLLAELANHPDITSLHTDAPLDESQKLSSQNDY